MSESGIVAPDGRPAELAQNEKEGTGHEFSIDQLVFKFGTDDAAALFDKISLPVYGQVKGPGGEVFGVVNGFQKGGVDPATAVIIIETSRALDKAAKEVSGLRDRVAKLEAYIEGHDPDAHKALGL